RRYCAVNVSPRRLTVTFIDEPGRPPPMSTSFDRTMVTRWPVLAGLLAAGTSYAPVSGTWAEKPSLLKLIVAAFDTVGAAPLTFAPSPSFTVTEKLVSGAVAETVTVTVPVTSNVDDPDPARL